MKNDAALWQRGMEWGKELLAPPPRSHAEAYRHELKYLISYADKAELAVRMAPVLHLDPHAKQGGYFIRSLYFDDYWNTAYAEKDAGVLLRKKYRVRVYNCSDRSIKLERKKKFGSWIYKEAAPLTRAEFERILAGDYDFLLHSPHRLCQEFYTECVSNVLRPRVIVDYDREPWILDAGTVRVTFDMGVRAAVGSWDIFDPTLPTPAGAGAGQAGAGSQVHRVSAPARAGSPPAPGAGADRRLQICAVLR